MTEAILARRIIHDQRLQGVSVVILDEFHERHLSTDLALAFLKNLRSRNPSIKLIVMSATLDIAPIAAFLPGAATVSLNQRPHDVDIEYEVMPDNCPLHTKVSAAVSRLFHEKIAGDILVFLPGSAEIRDAAKALQPALERFKFHLHSLHGNQPAAIQQKALEPAGGQKVILATNVAETSVTIPGIAAVIDSGYARVAGHSPWSGFPTLATVKISKSSAIQRAGRAGRTGAGRVLRLYTRADFESRVGHDVPEIKRSDLAETALMLHGSGVDDVRSFPWFDAPPDTALEAAETLLNRLGAIDDRGTITGIGKRMLAFPVHPRIARMIIEGEKRGIADEAALLSSLVSERDIRLDSRPDSSNGHPAIRTQASGLSDLLELLDRYREAEMAGFSAERLWSIGLEIAAVQAVKQGHRQLRRVLRELHSPHPEHANHEMAEEALLIAVLAAFPDRVARRRKAGASELLLSGGASARLSPASVVQQHEFMVAVEVEERREKLSLKSAGTHIRLASAIEVEWLAVLFPASLSQKTELRWNEKAERVDEVRQTFYEQLPIEASTRTAPPSEESARILASAALARGGSLFRDSDSVPGLRAKLSLAASHFPDLRWPDIGEPEIRDYVLRACRGKRSFTELTSVSFTDLLMEQLTDRQRSLLRRELPDRIRLASGRAVVIHYEESKPPWAASRLQDFFGTVSTPVICAGRVPLTLHLLAPSGRAVQVTRDLAGFWRNHYPAIRRELQRRYPRHAWPEKIV